MSYRGDYYILGAAASAETGAGAEVGTSCLGEVEELELARAVLAGDGETAGRICMKEYLRSLADEDKRSGRNLVQDSGAPATDPVKDIGRLLR